MAEARPLRLAILISGRGSNLQAFIDAISDGRLQATIVTVVSNRPDAEGLQRANAAGIKTLCIDHRDYPSRDAFDAALAAHINAFDPELVILAGFMRILGHNFIQHFTGRLMNVHPSLLPKYTGLHTHLRAIEAGDKEHGCTVHFVTEELDGGPPILHAQLEVGPLDTPDTLADRVLGLEHLVYPMAVSWFSSGRLTFQHGKALVDGDVLPPTGVAFHEHG